MFESRKEKKASERERESEEGKRLFVTSDALAGFFSPSSLAKLERKGDIDFFSERRVVGSGSFPADEYMLYWKSRHAYDHGARFTLT